MITQIEYFENNVNMHRVKEQINEFLKSLSKHETIIDIKYNPCVIRHAQDPLDDAEVLYTAIVIYNKDDSVPEGKYPPMDPNDLMV